jgi:chromosome segregation ATPase
MSADPHVPGASFVPRDRPMPGRLVTTSEAATMLGIDEGALWRLLDSAGVRVHVLHERDEQRVAITVPDLLYLRAHPGLVKGPRATVAGDLELTTTPLDREYQGPASRHARLEFELDLLRAERANARERATQLELALQVRVGEVERLRADLEEERGQRLQREILKSHLVRVGESMETTELRLAQLEHGLNQAMEDHRRELEELEQARKVERDALCTQRVRSEAELERRGGEIEALRRSVLVGKAERDGLRRKLNLAREIENSTQRHCDKLEERLRDA